MLMFFRALQGTTVGAGMIIGRAVVRDLFDGAAAQRLMSHVATIFTIAPVLGPVLGVVPGVVRLALDLRLHGGMAAFSS